MWQPPETQYHATRTYNVKTTEWDNKNEKQILFNFLSCEIHRIGLNARALTSEILSHTTPSGYIVNGFLELLKLLLSWPCAIGKDSLSNVNIMARGLNLIFAQLLSLNSIHPSFRLRATFILFFSVPLPLSSPFFTLSALYYPRDLCVCVHSISVVHRIFVRIFCFSFSFFVCFIFHFIPFFSVYLFNTDSNAGQREDKTCGDINRKTKSRWYRNKGSEKGKWKPKEKTQKILCSKTIPKRKQTPVNTRSSLHFYMAYTWSDFF